MWYNCIAYNLRNTKIIETFTSQFFHNEFPPSGSPQVSTQARSAVDLRGIRPWIRVEVQISLLMITDVNLFR